MANQGTTAWAAVDNDGQKPSLLGKPAQATGAVALQSCRWVPTIGARGRHAARVAIKAESTAHKRPNLPSVWHFVLCRLVSGGATLLKLMAAHGTRLPRHPKIKEITNSTRNIKNRSFAMPADAAAIPPNPRTAATSAMIRNNTAQPNISSPPHRLNRSWRLYRAPQLVGYWPLE